MKALLLFSALLLASMSYSQMSIQVDELDYGVATIEETSALPSEGSPAGQRSVSRTLKFVERTDSVQMVLKSSFGISYVLKAADSVDVDLEVEWIFPKKMVDNKGKKNKSIRYTTRKPTNTNLAHTYTFDEPYEMIEGQWTLHLYVGNKKLFSRTFVVYK